MKNPLPYYNAAFTVLKLLKDEKHIYSLRLHANSVGLLCIGPDHPLLSLPDDWAITKASYSDGAHQALATMSGRRKKGAGVLFPPAPLLTVTLTRVCSPGSGDDVTPNTLSIVIYLPIRLKLIEINDSLERFPWLLKTSHTNRGFLAIGLLRYDYAQALAATLPIQNRRLVDYEDLPPDEKERTPTEEQSAATARAVIIKLDSCMLST
ncbi:Hypothetical protein GLP15_63 [Giardia lamblia P15]|uniref:Uncharacterized protein n=1 Tax=Giardia intestinalis (strain P15) TaxID=658858 RepID=E1F8E4_GIAIA|nr:Hypothetical protein GLP15_63 [Giardia lamblia P15]